ncbi:MAG TPA: glycosyl hydrolase, partial [Verrucomicrobiae bacterium]|nr:glycosyl hydrolase [Verrucomicrobiae bacterium]
MKVFRLATILVFPLLLLAQQVDLVNQLRFRQIGPFRGGRVVAVAGVPSQPNVYYFGGVGGGVFKTTDSGLSWVPMSDGQFKTGSVGAIAVADSDPNVVYVGMGEACVRGNATHGDGVYKSV